MIQTNIEKEDRAKSNQEWYTIIIRVVGEQFTTILECGSKPII